MLKGDGTIGWCRPCTRAYWNERNPSRAPKPAPRPAPVLPAVIERPPPTGGEHVVGTIRFGRDGDPTRWTTCAACDFACTGESDEAMAREWSAHVRASRRSRSGPVERVAPGHREDDDSDEMDSDAA